jgi:hypothetical protein
LHGVLVATKFIGDVVPNGHHTVVGRPKLVTD